MIRADAFPPDVWEAICTPMHEIVPASARSGALYLGSWTAAVDADLLARHGVRAIVECHDAPWGGPAADAPPAFARSPTSPRLTTNASASAAARPGIARSVSSSGIQVQASTAAGASRETQPGRFKVAIADSAAPDLLAPHLDGAVRFIRERLNSAIVLAYLMRDRALSYDAALQIVKARRKCIKPNEGFEKTLRNWK